MAGIFMLGATGHMGGTILHEILARHPDVPVKALIRRHDKAARLTARYPQVQTVIGDLASLDLLESCSREAQLVINVAPDITHEDGIEAILRGLKARSTPGFYIHTSGASIIWDEPEASGEARVWDDIDDIQALLERDVKYTHCATDKLVRRAAPDVNVAILSPGFVGGISQSLERPTPITTPAILLTARSFQTGFQIGDGLNRHSWIHVDDLADMYAILAGHALANRTHVKCSDAGAEEVAVWGAEAYYFAASEENTFADLVKHAVPVLHRHGIISRAEVRHVTVQDAARASIGGDDYDADAPPPPSDSWAAHIAVMYGINMRIRASRMARLGWRPRKDMVATFDGLVGRHLAWEREQEGRAE